MVELIADRVGIKRAAGRTVWFERPTGIVMNAAGTWVPGLGPLESAIMTVT